MKRVQFFVKQHRYFILAIIGILTLSFTDLILEQKHINPTDMNIKYKDGTVQPYTYVLNQRDLLVDSRNLYYQKKILIIGDTSIIDSIIINKKNYDKKMLITCKQNFRNYAFPNLKLNNVYEVNNVLVATSNLYYFNQFINWKGDNQLFFSAFTNPLLVLTCLLYFIIIYYKPWIKKIVTPNNKQQLLQQKSLQHCVLAGLVFIIAIFLVLYQNSFYFLQDDNYAQFTPTILHGLHYWYSTGTVPTYNALIHNGIGTAEYTVYAFFYIPTHISYLVAKYLLRNVYYFNNVFTLLHFAVGYFFLLKYFNRVGVHFILATISALAFIFCGFNLMVTRSWYYVSPTIAFLPLLFYYATVYINKPLRLSQFLILVLLLTTYAYSGNIQFFCYTVIFLSIYFFYNTKYILHNSKIITLVLIATVILFIPQFVTTILSLSNFSRSGGEGPGVFKGIGSMLLPNIDKATLPTGFIASNNQFYFYTGAWYAAVVCLVVGIIFLATKKILIINNISKKQQQVLLFLIVIVLLSSFGRIGIVWWLISNLPLLNKFNTPFKMFIYAQFFITCLGTLYLSNIIQKFKKIYYYLLCFLLFLFTLYNLHNTTKALYVYNYKEPYTVPNYDKVLIYKDKYRITPLSVLRSKHNNYTSSLMQNFGILNGYHTTTGYESLYLNDNNYFANHAKLGVRYFVSNNFTADDSYFFNSNNFITNYNNNPLFKKIYTDSNFVIYEDTLAEPLIQLFSAAKIITNNWKLTTSNNGLRCLVYSSNSICDSAILNYNYSANSLIYCNGKLIPSYQDAYNRILVKPNVIVNTLQLKYVPAPFAKLYK